MARPGASGSVATKQRILEAPGGTSGVQQETLGHRGHKDDPLYEVRRLLRKGSDRLTNRQLGRLEAGLQAGDPDFAVTVAYTCAQQVRSIYHAPTPEQGCTLAEKLLATLPTCPIPEVGRTLRSWREELLAYFDPGRVSNGPTEAINLVIEKLRRTPTDSATSRTTGSAYAPRAVLTERGRVWACRTVGEAGRPSPPSPAHPHRGLGRGDAGGARLGDC